VSTTLFFSSTLSPLHHPPGGVEAAEHNATACTEWQETHHLLFHLGNLTLLLGLVIPTSLALHMTMMRLLLMTGLSGRGLQRHL